MRRNSVLKDPTRWARLAAGTRLRLGIMCGMSVGMGVLTLAGVRIMVAVVETRVEVGRQVLPLEQAVFALLCTSIIVGTIICPILSFIALRGLLREIDTRK